MKFCRCCAKFGLKEMVSNRAFAFYQSQGDYWMKSDRTCWIVSRTIKRGHVLVLDGSLVPFCSKCLDACMRANDFLKKFEKDLRVES